MITIHHPGIITIENFFSQAECLDQIAHAEAIGFSPASISTATGGRMNQDIRNNDRCILTDSALANALWPRTLPILQHFEVNAQPLCLNECFRFYRYGSAQQFKPHRDDSERIRGMVSRITLLIYLNDTFEGGETTFIRSVQQSGERQRTRLAIEPKTGSALFFLHRQIHEGTPVRSGTKYVLRTDVFYAQPNQP